MDAGKIYNSWPKMGETYFPNDNNFYDLLKISALSDPSLVQFIHRNLAYVICFFYIFICFKVYRNKFLFLYKPIIVLGSLIFLQIILGVITILNGAQILTASIHQISSIFLVSSSVYFFYINSRSNSAFKLGLSDASNACFKSAIMSSECSIPIDSLT